MGNCSSSSVGAIANTTTTLTNIAPTNSITPLPSITNFHVFKLLRHSYDLNFVVSYKNKYYKPYAIPENFISVYNNNDETSKTCKFGIVTNNILCDFVVIDVIFVEDNKIIVRIGKNFEYYKNIYTIHIQSDEDYEAHFKEIKKFRKILNFKYCSKYYTYNPQIQM